MKIIRFCLVFFANLFLVPAAFGEETNWPCVQRRVEEISFGQMWPEAAENLNAELSEHAKELALKLSLRRTSLDQAKELIDAYVITSEPKSHKDFAPIFSNILTHINKDRARLITGIEAYAKGQKERSLNIETIRSEMEKESANAKPDFDKIDALETKLDWEIRIYTEREKALSAVCETPILLEKRAYAVAQLMMKAMP